MYSAFHGKIEKIHDLFELKEGDKVAIENPGAYNTEAVVEYADDRSIVIGGIRYYRTTGNRWGRPDFNIIKNGLYRMIETKPMCKTAQKLAKCPREKNAIQSNCEERIQKLELRLQEKSKAFNETRAKLANAGRKVSKYRKDLLLLKGIEEEKNKAMRVMNDYHSENSKLVQQLEECRKKIAFYDNALRQKNKDIFTQIGEAAVEFFQKITNLFKGV
jgi:uncharacterized coiled-coil protein SlyX